jgi:hypothetical protein
MLIQEKLAYLREKLSVAQTLGDLDSAAMWQRLIEELEEGISSIPNPKASLHHGNLSLTHPEESQDEVNSSKATSASA